MKKKLTAVCVLTAAVCLFAATAFAETGDVAGVIQSTWQSAAQQIKTVVNTVVFPALDLILVLGCGMMLASTEVPRIAGAFGVDTSTRANVMGAVHTAQSVINTVRMVSSASG